MPQSTANAHAVVMTSHPLFSAFDRLRSTPATTPSPSRIMTRVPMNSPRKGDRIQFTHILISSRNCNTSGNQILLGKLLECSHLFRNPSLVLTHLLRHDACRWFGHGDGRVRVQKESACAPREHIFECARHL